MFLPWWRSGGVRVNPMIALLRFCGVRFQLDPEGLERRLDSAIRFIVSMYESREKNAFRGKGSDLFFSHLMDTLLDCCLPKSRRDLGVVPRGGDL